MSYHKSKIPKGKIGEFSKIEEEFLELKDGVEQEDKILQACELSDLIGAIELFASKKLNLSLEDLIKFSNKTQNAFKTGTRKNSSKKAFDKLMEYNKKEINDGVRLHYGKNIIDLKGEIFQDYTEEKFKNGFPYCDVGSMLILLLKNIEMGNYPENCLFLNSKSITRSLTPLSKQITSETVSQNVFDLIVVISEGSEVLLKSYLL